MQQTTIARRIACRGTGLHNGEPVELALSPAVADSGIVFVSIGGRADGGDAEILACAGAVHSTTRATTLSASAFSAEARPENSVAAIATVEHLLATLFVMGIDNVRVEVRGAEIPAMDGSASPFVDWIRPAGRESLDAPRREFSVVKRFEIREDDRWIRIEPADTLQISYAIDFAHPLIGRQALCVSSMDDETFEREIAGARTFAFEREVEALRNAGLARGGDLNNTVVLSESGILNPDGLRWPDEFVRHKILDLVGDLALFGAPLRGHIEVEKGGHALHQQMVNALIDRPELLAETGRESGS